ncbi:hypothetical protein Y88_3783 [Novosphingobium nitrogenifigens DSM 19370]|uniref:Uncharacterized protein n=1 Tax=Novosphingobium nitrogenifigens DSM 19370 TaxID=983920 RepID=F1ZD40_9SPHN|nr:hypothetical protein Y88_3783 [Novosphingobium nitrogenifigens DSM 19370]
MMHHVAILAVIWTTNGGLSGSSTTLAEMVSCLPGSVC